MDWPKLLLFHVFLAFVFFNISLFFCAVHYFMKNKRSSAEDSKCETHNWKEEGF